MKNVHLLYASSALQTVSTVYFIFGISMLRACETRLSWLYNERSKTLLVLFKIAILIFKNMQLLTTTLLILLAYTVN